MHHMQIWKSGSKSGHVVLLTDKQEEYFLHIDWQSKRIKRIVKSTWVAETMLVEAAETCFWLAKIIDKIFGYWEKTTQIQCYTYSQSLWNAVHSMIPLLTIRDWELIMTTLCEVMQKREVKELKWISSDTLI